MMEARSRSPSYPNTPITQAIEFVRKLHQIERTNPVDREVAAKAMGYTGLSGRSATILSDLSQYGLLDRAGKSEVRVTPLAVELLHPDDQHSWEGALREAARKPDLFQRVAERFTDGTPSEAALESFLIKQGFTYTAIPFALRAYLETISYVENATGSDSNSLAPTTVRDSLTDQRVDEGLQMNRLALTGPAKSDPPPPAGRQPVTAPSGADVRIVSGQILVSGALGHQGHVDDLIETLEFLRKKLKPAPVEAATGTDTVGADDAA